MSKRMGIPVIMLAQANREAVKKVEVDLAAERDKANAYQRENEILIRKIDSSLTVEELLRHLSKGGGNSVVIGIK